MNFECGHTDEVMSVDFKCVLYLYINAVYVTKKLRFLLSEEIDRPEPPVIVTGDFNRLVQSKFP